MDLPNSEIKLVSPASQADTLPAELPEKPIYMKIIMKENGINLKKKKREKGYLLIVAKRMLFSSSGLMNYIEEENNSVQWSRAKEVY